MKNCLSCDHYSDSYGRCRKGYSPGSCEREFAMDEAYSQMIRSEREKKKEKKITNGDRIRNMTDEELAKLLNDVDTNICNFCTAQYTNTYYYCEEESCEKCVLAWLKQEVPENDEL